MQAGWNSIVCEGRGKVQLEDFLGHDTGKALLITAASAPYHVEWVSKNWSISFGWSCEEVQGKVTIAKKKVPQGFLKTKLDTRDVI